MGNCLIDMYRKCGSMDDAVLIFEHMKEKDTVYWNVIVDSCSRNDKLEPRALVFPSDAKSRHCNIQRAHKCFRQSRRFQQCFSDSKEFA